MMDLLRAVWGFLSTPITIGSVQFPFDWLKLIGAGLILIAMFLVYRVVLVLLKKLLRATLAKERTERIVLHWSRIGLRILYVIGVFGLIGWLFAARAFEYLGKFFGILGEPLISSGSTSISFLTLLLTIPVFYLASWAGRMSRSVLDQSVLSRTGLDASKKFSIASLVRYGVMVIVALVGLSILGIDLSALAVIFGVLGIGVGFGLQNVVSNFFSGLIIILTRPIKERDRILVEGLDASVVHIRLLSTVINTVTDETIIIPNSLLVNNSVHNYSYDSPSIVITNPVGVSYGSDLDRVREVLDSVARDNPYASESGRREVRVEGFGSSSIDLLLLTSIGDVEDKFRAHSWTNLEIWRRFKAQGIQIPFPQVDVHMIDQGSDLRVSVARGTGGAEGGDRHIGDIDNGSSVEGEGGPDTAPRGDGRPDESSPGGGAE